jgi:glyoxylase-like metal-dependent hydrolase (beta-lactamase superfamily II)
MLAMTTMKGLALGAIFAAIGALTAPVATQAMQPRPQPPKSPRLYVFDCGTLEGDPARFNLTRKEMTTTDMSVACYLVVHPRGALIWDAGAVPDLEVKSENQRTRHRIQLMSSERYVTLARSLRGQLAEAGYAPGDITHLALSHYHYDHTANANEFASARWLVRQVERDAMFAQKPPDLVQRATFHALRNSKTVLIKTDDYDVFGDGSALIKWAPGHTPGHQVLFVKLARTGPVLLSGDLYHYPEERVLDRVPVFDVNPDQTRRTRTAIEAFLKKSGAQLWIQHDFTANAALKKGPSFYD